MEPRYLPFEQWSVLTKFVVMAAKVSAIIRAETNFQLKVVIISSQSECATRTCERKRNRLYVSFH